MAGPRAVAFRPAREGDLAPILEVYNHYVESSPATFEVAPVRADQRRDWFRQHTGDGRHRLWVATERNGRVIGWATSSAFRDRPAYSTTVESSVYVRPRCQGRGVGTGLYARLFASLENEDVERIVAGIVTPNPASEALHRRFGFRRVGTFHRVGRKFGRYWDVAWFERPLRRARVQVPAA